jgi:succinate dehydrogenase / fumarate reductase, membrane anchor subunit
MAQTFGSKRTVVGAHYGLRDWLAQRITSVVMALFTVAVIVQILMPGEMGYDKWSGMFSRQWMKVLTFTTVISLLLHAWVGVRDILMDYVKPDGLRLTLQVLFVLLLAAYLGWAIQILWR